jgi:hypothetical protein
MWLFLRGPQAALLWPHVATLVQGSQALRTWALSSLTCIIEPTYRSGLYTDLWLCLEGESGDRVFSAPLGVS